MDGGFIGRLVGKSTVELWFRSFYTTPLAIGGIVMACDEQSDRKYLMRITDISYGHESTEANWAEKAAGRMMEEELQGGSYRIHDPERRLYKLARCSPLGYVADGRFHRPRSIPSHFSRVVLPDRETMAFLQAYSGDLTVGDLRCGEGTLDIPLGLDGGSLVQHVGIFATTGMGKSNLVKVLAAAVMENGRYGLLIFDPHGEYFDGGKGSGRKGLIHHPLADKRLFTYTRRKVEGKHNSLAIPATQIEIEDVAQIFSFSQAQYEALHAVRLRYGHEWLNKLVGGDIETLTDDLKVGNSSFQEMTLGVLIRRAERIKSFSSIVHDNSISTLTDIINKIQHGYTVLVDTANLSQAEETLVTSVITRAVLHDYRYRYQSSEDFERLAPCLMILEEAQRVLAASAGDSNIFHQAVREGRKFRVGLGVVTQQPKLLSEELLSQLNSMFILGLADERDRTIVRGSAKQDISALGTEIQTLSAGEALLTAPAVPFALPLKIFLYEDYLKNHTIDRKTPSNKVPDDFF
ncbi:MAG: ATP-binding protein [candidate division Zixibacteria bacterium]|nr:ATP-binding protein [candidate division Zixibacteria bacterium]